MGDDEWEVATGTIIESPDDALKTRLFGQHAHVSDTKDGGLSVWIPSSNQEQSPFQALADISTIASSTTQNDTLPASCHCGTVKFHITRPNTSSRLARSDYPDLMIPVKSRTLSHTNISDEKWWLRAKNAKYLAGTCACRSCRLISGFEIQVWTFVPRANIFFHVPSTDSNGAKAIVPLKFSALPSGILNTYESSPGVLREFCPHCGATVFWHDKWNRPGLIDVSAGLLRANEGARAESWLDWWRDRCSFAEDTEVGRKGWVASEAKELIDSLEKGMKGDSL